MSATTTSSPSPTSACGRCSSSLSPARLWWWWLTWNSVKERTGNMSSCTRARTSTPTLARREEAYGGRICWVWSSKLDLTQLFSISCFSYIMDMTCPGNAGNLLLLKWTSVVLNSLKPAVLFSVRLSKCQLSPCPNTVDCFISRPTEKKIFMLFMVISSAVCILMCILEMIYLIGKRIMKILKIRHENERLVFADQHELTTIAPARSQCRSRRDPTVTDSELELSKRKDAKTTVL